MSAAAVPSELLAVGELTGPEHRIHTPESDKFAAEQAEHAEQQAHSSATAVHSKDMPLRASNTHQGYIGEKLEMLANGVKYLFGRAGNENKPQQQTPKISEASRPATIAPFTPATGASGLAPGYEANPAPVGASPVKINDAVPSMPVLPEPVLGQHHEGAHELGRPLGTGTKIKNALLSGVEKVMQDSDAVHAAINGPEPVAPHAAEELENFKLEDHAFHSQGALQGLTQQHKA